MSFVFYIDKVLNTQSFSFKYSLEIRGLENAMNAMFIDVY